MERHGTATWPGAIAVVSCDYTLSHGISPGIATLVIAPQASYPNETGDLVIDDGVESITIPGCKIQQMTVEPTSDGFVWRFTILDRRWKWQDLGGIEGVYNQLDPHTKLIPWTIRSPREAAELCLKAMGETGYTIDMPPGLDRAVGVMHGQLNPPHIGVVPITGTNPPINWEVEPPAQALARLCEMFGRRVIYRLATDSILIERPGVGGDLPAGSIAKESPSITRPATPVGVEAVGMPTRYQSRFDVGEAVGKDWDGHFYPINELSYAPNIGGKVQISEATAVCDGSTNIFQVFIGAAPDASPRAGAMFEVSDDDPAVAAAVLATVINASADPRVAGVVKASDDGNGKLTVTGVREGVPFVFWANLSGSVAGEANFTAGLIQAAQLPRRSWSQSKPPEFAGIPINGTNRLTFEQCRQLAIDTVFKCYRLTNRGPWGARNETLRVPGVPGDIKRRQQIVLLPDQVDQVVPVPPDPNLVVPNLVGPGQPNAFAQGVIDLYNGYSRNKPAAMFGQIALEIALKHGRLFWHPDIRNQNRNTSVDAQIFVPFSIDPIEQVVTFSTWVYKVDGPLTLPIGYATLQTACHVRDADTNALRRLHMSRLIGSNDVRIDQPAPNFATRVYQDLQLHLVGLYDERGKIKGAKELAADANDRGRYYLDGMESQYFTQAGDTKQYNGIRAIDCDGAIAQVSWSIGEGARTTASKNTEHSIWIAPYPARRLAEFLRPANRDAIRQGAQPQNLGDALMGGPGYVKGVH